MITILQAVRDHMLSGGYIQVSTYTRSWIYKPNQIDLFGEDDKGRLTIKQGKRVISLWGSKIDFLTLETNKP
jgi:hypothetical protein